ncbi:MAG: DUF1071 domain-containing protein [Burkholderiaceae bacterium]|jgi:hypothetical protein|nr:DUF1071 domain-containing protein [Burkholderiaceae bacterium]
MSDNYFAVLNRINVNEHVEKKGQFSYLSWPFAVAQLRLADPTACWEVRRFDGLPFLRSETGYFVEVAVTVQGVTLSQVHPVLDGKNRPLMEPTCFDINASIQRALVKAIALHGLGLYIYAGEDLPEGDGEAPAKPAETVAPRTPSASVTPMAKAASAAQTRYITRLLEETGSDLEHLLEYFGVTALEELTSQAASRAIRSLEQRRRAA